MIGSSPDKFEIGIAVMTFPLACAKAGAERPPTKVVPIAAVAAFKKVLRFNSFPFSVYRQYENDDRLLLKFLVILRGAKGLRWHYEVEQDEIIRRANSRYHLLMCEKDVTVVEHRCPEGNVEGRAFRRGVF